MSILQKEMIQSFQKFPKSGFLAAFVFLAACTSEPEPTGTESSVSEPAATESTQQASGEPTFEVLSSEPVALLSDERVLMINYWATWCIPCIEEMPELAHFREEHIDQVEIYAVNYDDPDIEQLKKDVEELGVEIPSLLEDPAETLGYQRPIVLPTTVIVHKGEVKEVLVGPQTGETLGETLEKWVM